MVDKAKPQTDSSSMSLTDFLPRLEKGNKRASGFLIPQAKERTIEREEEARQLVREDILAAAGVSNLPKVCFIESQKATSYDLRSGLPLQHCSEEQVKKFNEDPLPRLGKSFLLKRLDEEPNVIRIETQPADLQVFLTNGEQELPYLSEAVDIEALMQEAEQSEANALLIPFAQEAEDKSETSDTEIQFDSGGYERTRENKISREKSVNVDLRNSRTQARAV